MFSVYVTIWLLRQDKARARTEANQTNIVEFLLNHSDVMCIFEPN